MLKFVSLPRGFCCAWLCASAFFFSSILRAEIDWKPAEIRLSVPDSAISVNLPRLTYEWRLVQRELASGGLSYRFRSERNAFHLTVYMTRHNCGTARECLEFEWNMSSVFGPVRQGVEKFDRGRFSILVYNVENLEGSSGRVTVVKAYTLQDDFMISVSTDARSAQPLDPEFFLALIDQVRITGSAEGAQ